MALCECGCGEETRLAPCTAASKGWVKGQPLRFAGVGHNARVDHPRTGLFGEANPLFGRKVSEAERQRRREAAQRGADCWNWTGDNASYVTIHKWAESHFTKTGTCEECQAIVGTAQRGGTQWSSIDHTYTRNREDWRELCSTCHVAYDQENGLRRFGT